MGGGRDDGGLSPGKLPIYNLSSEIFKLFLTHAKKIPLAIYVIIFPLLWLVTMLT